MATNPESFETQETTTAKRGVNGAQLGLVLGALLLVLALVWFFVLRGNGDEPAAQAPLTTSETPGGVPDDLEPQPDDRPEGAGEKDKNGRKGGPVETFELFASKDPFEPLIDETPATASSGGTTDGGTTDGGTTDGGTTDGGTTDGGTTDGGTTDGGTTDGGTTGGGGDVGGHSVRLVDVFQANGGARAQVEIDGTVYTVDEGETFAENFQLVSVSGQCATLLFGDDQFTLCEGEEILK